MAMLLNWHVQIDSTLNPASEYVESSRDTSPLHRYVSDEGEGVSKQDIEHVTVAGRPIALADEVTAEERTLITEAIRATTPSEKACFVNALKMWEYDSRFAYAEGFTVMSDLDLGGIEHAWCMLDGEKLVDVTQRRTTRSRSITTSGRCSGRESKPGRRNSPLSKPRPSNPGTLFTTIQLLTKHAPTNSSRRSSNTHRRSRLTNNQHHSPTLAC